MIKEIDIILKVFSSCFSRSAAFSWFTLTIMGFIVRLDFLGVTSFIRWLSLEPNCYETYLNFFHASSWNLGQIQDCWINFIKTQCSPHTINERILALGDCIKVSKEAMKTPVVKRMHQDSDNSGKPSFIYGHNFGAIGFLIGKLPNLFCIPAKLELHEGVDTLRSFQGKAAPVVDKEKSVTIVTLMVAMAIDVARSMNHPIMLVLDAFYAVGPTFIMARQCLSDCDQHLIHVITRAKSNIVGYEDPCPPTGKRGRPPVWGKRVKLKEQFKQRENEFQTIPIYIYGKQKTLSCLCLDLLWKPIKGKARFVLIKDGNDCYILMCSDLTWSAKDIILSYSYRFKIEVTFKNLKHLLGSFCYHFWSKVIPSLGKKSSVDLSCITNESHKKLIAKTANAIEGFVNFGGIALGILQIMATKYPQSVWDNYVGWLRTKRTDVPSEATVRSVIQETFYHNFCDFSDTAIHAIITSKKRQRLHLYATDTAQEVVNF